tara:strand:- start:379 stop:780 length:402 start_codon:yes stop_codon:yes gene_type:complete
MALESAADFNSYVNPGVGGVSATFFEVQSVLWDQRRGLIDAWFDIDSGDAYSINILIDQEFFNIQGNTLGIEGYQPRAKILATDAPYISIDDKLIVDAVTTNNGSTLTPQVEFKVVSSQPDNCGMVDLVLAVN